MRPGRRRLRTPPIAGVGGNRPEARLSRRLSGVADDVQLRPESATSATRPSRTSSGTLVDPLQLVGPAGDPLGGRPRRTGIAISASGANWKARTSSTPKDEPGQEAIAVGHVESAEAGRDPSRLSDSPSRTRPRAPLPRSIEQRLDDIASADPAAGEERRAGGAGPGRRPSSRSTRGAAGPLAATASRRPRGRSQPRTAGSASGTGAIGERRAKPSCRSLHAPWTSAESHQGIGSSDFSSGAFAATAAASVGPSQAFSQTLEEPRRAFPWRRSSSAEMIDPRGDRPVLECGGRRPPRSARRRRYRRGPAGASRGRTPALLDALGGDPGREAVGLNPDPALAVRPKRSSIAVSREPSRGVAAVGQERLGQRGGQASGVQGGPAAPPAARRPGTCRAPG